MNEAHSLVFLFESLFLESFSHLARICPVILTVRDVTCEQPQLEDPFHATVSDEQTQKHIVASQIMLLCIHTIPYE